MLAAHTLCSGYWRGHHVHSPYVFHVVRDVITTRRRNKAILARQKAFRKSLSASGGQASAGLLGYKYSLLLSRLGADMQPESVVLVGDRSGYHEFCISLGAERASFVSVAEAGAEARQALQTALRTHSAGASVEAGGGKAFMLFLDAGEAPDCADNERRLLNVFLSEAKPLSVIVFNGVFSSPAQTQLWRSLVTDSRVSTTIEMAQLGLAYVRSGCQKEHYRLRW